MAKQKKQEEKNVKKTAKLSTYQKERNQEASKSKSKKKSDRRNVGMGVTNASSSVRIPGENMRGKPQFKRRAAG